MSEFDVKMQLLDLSGGDVDKARLMFAWLNESTPYPAAAVQKGEAEAYRLQGVLSTGGL